MRIAVLADIHSNLEALQAVLRSFEEIDAVWCVGDIVGYGADPGRCLDLLASLKTPVTAIAGNHDLGVLGLLRLDSFVFEGREAVNWTKAALTEQQLKLMPDKPVVLLEDRGATLVHGSLTDPVWEYIVSAETAAMSFDRLKTPLGFFGHTHLPMIYYMAAPGDRPRELKPVPGERIFLSELGERWLVNPGSVGQPRDRDSRACYLVLDDERMVIIYHRCDYHLEKSSKKIITAGLPGSLADRLALGI